MTKLSGVSTVVGSFPYPNSPQNMEAAFWDQINAGVDYPCYPQLIGMVEQFLDPVSRLNCGLQKDGKIYRITEEFTPPKTPVATEFGQFVLDFFKKYPEAKAKVKGWKACLTGPFTLAGDIVIPEKLAEDKSAIIYQEPRAIMNASLVEKLAEMMASVAKMYAEMGATIISMDEPTLALIVGKRKTLYHQEDTIINILNKAIAPIQTYASVHVCGRLAPKLRDILLSSNVKIMDHEFTNGDNDGIFEKSMLNREDKTLAYGVLQSSVQFQKDGTLETYSESSDIIRKRIQKAQDSLGAENLIFKPDCGFGGLLASFGQELGSEIVRTKLSRLSQILHEK
jgi:methionine synthase II (cobalamin-independent)